MKNYLSIVLVAMVSGFLLVGCTSKVEPEAIPEETEVMTFDSLRAQQLGADDYGMKSYVMAFLKTGPEKYDSATTAELGMGHMKNIGRLAEEGKLVLAGPFMGDSIYRGIYVFDVKSIEEARELTMTDPAIKAGVFEIQLIPWYGSAALMEVNEIHEQIAKISF